MTQKSIWRVVPIALLCVGLATPAWADQPRLAANVGGGLQKAGEEVVAGIVVAAVAVVIVVALLVRHDKPQRITGCVSSGANGMSVTDEKDKRDYALSGDAAGVKPGDRMTLEGKREHAGQALVFDTRKVTRDFGACQP